MAEITYVCNDVIQDAAVECGAIAPGEVLDGETASWMFRKFNYLIDTLQAGEAWAYGYQYNVYTLVANLNPHTIGPADIIPAPTFSTGTQPRPVRLESAALLLNISSTLTDVPMNIQDHDWYANNQTKNITSSVPTDVYYDPLNPIGSLYFWPVPNVGNNVRLQFWTTVSQYETITDPIGGAGGPGTLPIGYRNALMLTLAETCCAGLQKPIPGGLAQQALQARAAVFGNNAGSPRSASSDYGMPVSGARAGSRQDFNWAYGNYPGGRPQ